jgi:hypothetical protein
MARFEALARGERESSFLAAYRKKKKAARDEKRRGNIRKRKRKVRRSVAKVAAVVGYEGKAGERPKIPGMWIDTVERLDQFIFQTADEAMRSVLNGTNPKPPIVRLGTRLQMAMRADVIRTGHVDTRLLLKTVAWELVDAEAQEAHKALLKAKREARKLARQMAAQQVNA